MSYGGELRSANAGWRICGIAGDGQPAFLDADHVGVKLAHRGGNVEWLPEEPEAAMQVEAGHSELVNVGSLPSPSCRGPGP